MYLSIFAHTNIVLIFIIIIMIPTRSTSPVTIIL